VMMWFERDMQAQLAMRDSTQDTGPQCCMRQQDM
jgi:hypothetical protein